MVVFLSIVLTFVIGACIGMLFGIDVVPVFSDSPPTKTRYDLIMLVATIIAATGTAVATALALHIYRNWQRQQHEIDLMGARKLMIANISSLETAIVQLLGGYRLGFDGSRKEERESKASLALIELKTNLKLYAVLSSKSIEEIKDPLLIEERYLTDSQLFYKICSTILLASYEGNIKSVHKKGLTNDVIFESNSGLSLGDRYAVLTQIIEQAQNNKLPMFVRDLSSEAMKTLVKKNSNT